MGNFLNKEISAPASFGLYGIYVTVSNDYSRFIEFNKTLNIKTVIIDYPSISSKQREIMTSIHYSAYNLDTCIDYVSLLKECYEKQGFNIQRIKVEHIIDANRIDTLRKGEYIEYHIKIQVPLSNLVILDKILKDNDCGMSTNILSEKKPTTDHVYSLLTMKWFEKSDYNDRVAQLVKSLTDIDINVISIEKEHVVYDTNPELDKGWVPVGKGF